MMTLRTSFRFLQNISSLGLLRIFSRVISQAFVDTTTEIPMFIVAGECALILARTAVIQFCYPSHVSIQIPANHGDG